MTFFILCFFNFIRISICYSTYYGNNGQNALVQKFDPNDYNLKLNEVLNSENGFQLDSASVAKLYSKFQLPRKSEAKYVAYKDNQRGLTDLINKKPSKSDRNDTAKPAKIILMMRKATWGVSCSSQPKGECAFASDCSRLAVIPSKNIDCLNLYPNLDLVCCGLDQQVGPVPTLRPIPPILSDDVFASDSDGSSDSSSDSDDSDSSNASKSKKHKSKNKSKNYPKPEVSMESFEKWKNLNNKKEFTGIKNFKNLSVLSFEDFKNQNKKNREPLDKKSLDKKPVKDVSILSLENFEKNGETQKIKKKLHKKINKKIQKKIHRKNQREHKNKMKKYRKKHRSGYNTIPIKKGKYMNINNNAKKQDVFIIPSDLMGSDNNDVIKKIVILKKSDRNYNLAEMPESEISLSNE